MLGWICRLLSITNVMAEIFYNWNYSLILEKNLNCKTKQKKQTNNNKNTVNFAILSVGSFLPLDQFNTYASKNCSQSVLEVGLLVKERYIYLGILTHPWGSQIFCVLWSLFWRSMSDANTEATRHRHKHMIKFRDHNFLKIIWSLSPHYLSRRPSTWVALKAVPPLSSQELKYCLVAWLFVIKKGQDKQEKGNLTVHKTSKYTLSLYTAKVRDSATACPG